MLLTDRQLQRAIDELRREIMDRLDSLRRGHACHDTIIVRLMDDVEALKDRRRRAA